MLDAAWRKAVCDTVSALIALPRLLGLGSEKNGSERAGEHAKAATLALGLIDDDKAVFLFGYRLGRASGHAGWLVAVETRDEDEILMELAVDPARSHRLHSGPSRSRRQVVLLFAGRLAGVTADASVDVNQKDPWFHQPLLLTRQSWQRI
jgi:hypothetical protein